MKTKTFVIRKPDDWHVHLRWTDDGMLQLVLPFTAGYFSRALVMPNLTEQGMVLNAGHVDLYRRMIEIELEASGISDFQPLMTVRIIPKTTPEVIREAKKAGVIAGKLYPDGVTTGSEGGVRDFKALYPLFAFMQELDLILSIHCELPGAAPLKAEQEFIPILIDLVSNFPRLRIVVEHVSSKAMLSYLQTTPKTVGATITAHHLVLTHEEVYCGGQIAWPHNYCKPVAKTQSDQIALVQAATSGNPRFWFGSDTAPHKKKKKESIPPAAGVFSAPVALSVLAQVFADAGVLNRLEDFTSRFGAEFYRLPFNTGTLTLSQKRWVVPKKYGQVVPFLAGQQLAWQIAG